MNRYRIIFPAAAAVLLLWSCSNKKTEPTENADPNAAEMERYDLALSDKLDIFSPLPSSAANPENLASAAKIKLGQYLYFDERLSKDNKISCNSCHNLKSFGVDNLPTSPGNDGKNGDRNSPTVLNAALHTTQFWDGRAKDVEEQAGGPILNPVEMAIPGEKFVLDRLAGLDLYKKLFADAFPGEGNPFTYKNLTHAIAAFERTLLTPSKFDKYLMGDKSALDLEEKRGLLAFINTGCTSCHSGDILGGKMFQKFGVHTDYWKLTGSNRIDEGMFARTKNENDKYVFKVPSLRNVAKTAPYFHDGSVKDLNEAVKIMAKAQLNVDLSAEEVTRISAFLNTLTGEIPAGATEEPAELKSLH